MIETLKGLAEQAACDLCDGKNSDTWELTGKVLLPYLQQARNAALEEAALICNEIEEQSDTAAGHLAAGHAAEAIRSLATTNNLLTSTNLVDGDMP